jgi:hypothetical protein
MLLACGTALLLIYAVGLAYGAPSSHAELRRFWHAHSSSPNSESARDPDFRLWSEQRIAAYHASLRSQPTAPLGVLKISAIDLEVPVLQGN